MSQTALLAKLHKIAKSIDFIEKRGENKHHNYSFVQSVDVVRDVRDKLLEEDLVVIPGATNVHHLPYQASRGGAAHLTTVALNYRVMDVETGATIEIPWVGVGADTGGDKGVYKAYTGGLKYALLSLFLVPTSDDPERDQLTEAHAPEQHPDDARPAATRIPQDRAEAILESALAVGMATREDGQAPDLNPVFKAVLAQQGVEKIGALNVDQAEAVEAFLASEAQSS